MSGYITADHSYVDVTRQSSGRPDFAGGEGVQFITDLTTVGVVLMVLHRGDFDFPD